MNPLAIFLLIAVVVAAVVATALAANQRHMDDAGDDGYRYEWIATDGAYVTSFRNRPRPGMLFVTDGPNGERVMEIVEVNHELLYLEAVDVTDELKGR